MDDYKDSQDLIITKARQGDYQAFTMLLERYKGLVYQLSWKMSGNKEDAMDISQDVFMKLYSNIHSYNPAHKFSSWLYRMTVNASIDFYRKQKRHKITSLDATFQGQPISAVVKSKEASPYEKVSATELREIFCQLAEQLPINQRTTFVLKDLEGKSTQEIADILNISTATVRSHLHVARKKLRTMLEQYYPDLLEHYKK